jgi:hypothetical protein
MLSSKSSPLFKQKIAKAIADLRDATARAAWVQWAGIFTFPSTRQRAEAIVDPEALLLGSFAVSNYERRLPTVTYLWARDQSSLLSVQRAKNLATRFPRGVQDELSRFALIALHEGGDLRWRSLAVGSMKTTSETGRQKHGSPVLEGPASIMLRLRLGLGVGIKPDVVAYLIGLAGARATVQGIAEATAYYGRAVRRGVEELAAAGFVEPRPTAPVSYRVDAHKWASLLALDPQNPPAWRSWASFYAFVAALSEWAAALPESDFVLASEARDLLLEYGTALEGTVRLPFIGGTTGEGMLPLFLEALNACADWVDGVV